MNVTIYMKSGNKIVLDRIKDCIVKANGNSINSLHITQNKHWSCRIKENLLVASIDLSQIEAITHD